jgi:hypothetical protein
MRTPEDNPLRARGIHIVHFEKQGLIMRSKICQAEECRDPRKIQ